MFQPKPKNDNFYQHEVKEFEEKIVQVNRVSKKTTGGNKIGFSVLVVIGDKKGQVAAGLGQAPEVQSAVKKAVNYAKKHLIRVPLRGTTIPHEVRVKVGAAKIMLKPAPPGSGVIAGGSVRAVVEAAGIRDISSKVLGTNNQANNVYATLEALSRLRQPKVLVTTSPVAKVEGENIPEEKPAETKEKKSKKKTKTEVS